MARELVYHAENPELAPWYFMKYAGLDMPVIPSPERWRQEDQRLKIVFTLRVHEQPGLSKTLPHKNCSSYCKHQYPRSLQMPPTNMQ